MMMGGIVYLERNFLLRSFLFLFLFFGRTKLRKNICANSTNRFLLLGFNELSSACDLKCSCNVHTWKNMSASVKSLTDQRPFLQELSNVLHDVVAHKCTSSSIHQSSIRCYFLLLAGKKIQNLHWLLVGKIPHHQRRNGAKILFFFSFFALTT